MAISSGAAALRAKLRAMSVGRRWSLAMVSGASVMTILVLAWPRASVSSTSPQAHALELLPTDVAVVRIDTLDGKVPFTGTLAPLRQMLLNARVAGEVTAVPVREGEQVAAGTLLLRQDNREMTARLAQAEASVQSTKSELENSKAQYEKFLQLSMKSYFARSELDRANTQVEVYRSQLKANEAAVAMAKKSLQDVSMVAPFAGIVSERMVEPGQLVMPNTPLLRVVDLREMELAIQLPSSEIARVRNGQKITFQVDAFGDEVFTATVVRINPMAKVSNRKITVYAAVANPDMRLRGGLFVHGQLKDSNVATGLIIPTTSVQTLEGKTGVMVIRQKQLVWQPVTLGASNDRSAEVMVQEGLKEGEVVVATRISPRRIGAPVRMTEFSQDENSPASGTEQSVLEKSMSGKKVTEKTAPATSAMLAGKAG
ncbi:MAG: efflux RND transporter periplasmic adaptor subunit [Moraxellaceae bacterium]